MARNRKRAKDRRTRRPTQAGSSQPGGRSSVPGVLPGVPTVTDEPSPGLEPGANGAPDPLEHATPDAELADAQLAYGRPAEPEPADEADESEFELEVEESIEREPARGAVAAPEAAHVERRAGIFERLIGFLQGCWRELQRVQWPDRPQVIQATGVVIGFVIVAAAFLGLADFVAGKIVTFILK